MTAIGTCPIAWCNEAGEHPVHRQYIASEQAWHGAWFIGVNVVQAAEQPRSIELTVTTRRGTPAIIPLEPADAASIDQALVQAAERAIR